MPEASRSGATSPVSRLNPPALLDSTGLGLSQISVVEDGRLAFLSGQTATPRERGEIPPELADQVTVVADNLAAALDALGASPDDVILLRMFVVDATTERFEAAWAPIHRMLDRNMPSMTGVGVQALWTAALQLEIEMVVRVP